jgi:hypothetical protein
MSEKTPVSTISASARLVIRLRADHHAVVDARDADPGFDIVNAVAHRAKIGVGGKGSGQHLAVTPCGQQAVAAGNDAPVDHPRIFQQFLDKAFQRRQVKGQHGVGGHGGEHDGRGRRPLHQGFFVGDFQKRQAGPDQQRQGDRFDHRDPDDGFETK